MTSHPTTKNPFVLVEICPERVNNRFPCFITPHIPFSRQQLTHHPLHFLSKDKGRREGSLEIKRGNVRVLGLSFIYSRKKRAVETVKKGKAVSFYNWLSERWEGLNEFNFLSNSFPSHIISANKNFPVPLPIPPVAKRTWYRPNLMKTRATPLKFQNSF